MRKSSKRRRGLASALGLSLLAMLALGAFGASAAQAAPQWHVEGSVFEGSETVSWASVGTATLKSATGSEVSCKELTGTSTVTGGNTDSGTITLSKCSLVGLPACTVEPVKFPFTGSLASGGSYGYEKLITSSVLKITACAWATSFELSGSIGAQIGEELFQSGRSFSKASDEAAGATGLGSWRLTANANSTLTGSHKGSRFGTGGAWVPEETLTWTVGGAKFLSPAEESIQVSKVGAATLTSPEGEQMQCAVAASGLKIFGSHQSSGTITFQSCKMTTNPACVVTKSVPLSTAGYIGYDEALAKRERVDVSGGVFGSNGECPFEKGVVTGSIAATLSQNGIALKKKFESKAETLTGAPGLLIDGARWKVSMEVEETLSGANAGKALGVI